MKHNRKIIYLVGFLFSFPLALNSYINSSFLAGFVGEKWVGIVYTLASIAAILALILAPKIFKKLGGYKFLLAISLLDVLSLLFFSKVESAPLAVAIFIVGLALNTLIVFTLDEFLKIFSKTESTGRTRGTYIAICNLAWIFSQLASGTILSGDSFRQIYFISFAIMAVFLVVSAFRFKGLPDPKYDQASVFKYMKSFFKNSHLARAFKMNFLLQFFYSWMVVYTPIYLFSHMGFTWSQIGLVFAFMLLPFSIFPMPLGRYCDRAGERTFLLCGFALIALATISIFFTSTHSLFVWAGILFLTRAGAATIEVMCDSYFFKHIRPENEEFIGVYRSANPFAYIVGPLSASIVFLLVPSFNFIYLVLGGIMLSGLYISSRIKKGDL
jgi:MFS family permease